MAIIISSQDLVKSFGVRPLFTGLSIGVSEWERIGLIGPNGAGKSTLLKIFAGIETCDDGELAINKNFKICYLPQEEIFNEKATVHDVLKDALLKSPLEDYERDIEASMMLDRLGFNNPEQLAKNLSGGWKKRLAIAKQIILKPDLLLMDEPTNHLDLEGILWLESFLKEARFAYVAVSHDRYFLEHVSNRVIEINRLYPGGHFSSQGAYSDFLEKSEEYKAGQRQQQETLANRVRREVEWLRRGPPARTTKANARIKGAHQLIDDLDEIKYRNSQTKSVRIDFTASDRRTKKLLLAEGISKTRGDRKLFSDLDLLLSPGTRLGLLGPNGSGKSTLLQIIKGSLKEDSGKIERADNLKVVYFDQSREQLDNSLTLKKALSPDGDQVIYRGKPVHVATWAKRFLFSVEQLGTPIKDLSGGERARILIARLMQQDADLLILDEPTNDLDIPTLEVLEESLMEFPGALVLVTHDRYMLDRVSNQLLALDGEGGAGYYADYAQWENEAKKKMMASTSTKKQPPAEKPAVKPRKLSYKEQRELELMEGQILEAEKKVEELGKRVEESADDPDKMTKACEQLQAAVEEVERRYKRWGELEELRKSMA